MIYVLLAIALLGFLTVTLSRQNDQADGQEISDELAELYANELMEYVAAAENVVTMMIATGSEVNDLVFLNPASAGFSTGSHIHKVFHPQGGGLNYETASFPPFKNVVEPGWYFINSINIEWTPTAANDVILTAFEVENSVCRKINEAITGSTDIPIHTGIGANPQDHFVGGTDDFTATQCPECDGKPIFCIENTVQTKCICYNIIAAQ